PGSAATCGEEREIDPSIAVLFQLANGDWLAAEGQPLPGRSRRSEKTQLRNRQAPCLETADELDTDRARGADDRHDGRRTHCHHNPKFFNRSSMAERLRRLSICTAQDCTGQTSPHELVRFSYEQPLACVLTY